jgi:hypothetical protein
MNQVCSPLSRGGYPEGMVNWDVKGDINVDQTMWPFKEYTYRQGDDRLGKLIDKAGLSSPWWIQDVGMVWIYTILSQINQNHVKEHFCYIASKFSLPCIYSGY